MQTLLVTLRRATCKPRRTRFVCRLGFAVLFLLLSAGVYAQGNKISGQVRNESGEPVSGASVQVKGTANGAIADNSGNFSIAAPANSTLVVSSVGYLPQEIKGIHQGPVAVVLIRAAADENTVVVIGYGNQRKEAVTGSVASINGNTMREVPASNITNALQGRVAGVNMAQTSTKPGATMQIRIRGTRSITASNDPLIVLDGIPFPGTIADISPDDVKSVDILKDASATAIYGSRGANGVILVTTYSGNKNQKPRISYSGYVGMNKAIKYPMMDAKEFAALRARAGMNTKPGADEPVDTAGNYTANTDWQDLFFQTGIINNHDISIIGGTEKGSYKFGSGFYNEQSVVPLSWYKRFSLRGSVDQKIGIFRLGFTTNNNYNVTNGANIGLYGVLSMSPVASPYDSAGAIKRTVKMPQDEQWVYTRSTMAALGDEYANVTKAFGSYNSAFAEVEIPGVQGLKVRVNLGGSYRQSNGGSYTGAGVFSSSATTPNSASTSNSQTLSWSNENLVTYDRVFGGKHQVNAVAMYSMEQNTYNYSSISRKNIAADAFQYYNLGQSSTSLNDDITINPNNQSYSQSGLTSYMGRVMYAYESRYMLSATLRSDASSRLAKGHQWHTYPAISAGWNIGKESFMKGVSWIDALKLRAGWGQTSNQSVAPYATLGTLSTVPYNFGTTGYGTGYYVSQLPNPNLGWEYSITSNLGLDFTLFKNRLSGTFEYYSTRTKDLLLSVAMPSTSGVNSYVGNVGETSNKGWELSLNGTIINNANGWSWDLGANVYTNKNRIVKLASGQTQDINNYWFVGHPLNVIYDYKKIGIWQADDPYLSILEPGSSNKPGMIKVQYTGTYNPDGTPTRAIGAADMQVTDADPKFTGGFNTRVAYKNIDLTIVGLFQSGGILNSTLYGAAGYLNLEDGRRGQIKINYWTEDNLNASFPDPNGPKNSNNPKYASTLGYFDASYLKISTATLGYNFNSNWMKKAGIYRLRAYFTVQNPLVLFSPYHKQSGMDPQTNSYANDGSMMAVPYSGALSRLLTVGYNSPSTHNYMMGVNVTF